MDTTLNLIGIALTITVVVMLALGLRKSRSAATGDQIASGLRFYKIAATVAALALLLGLFDLDWFSLADAATAAVTAANVHVARKRLGFVRSTERLRAEKLARENDLPWVGEPA